MPSPRLALAHPRAAAALAVAERGLAFYIEEAATAQSPPISRADAQALQAVLAGGGKWRPELFDRLILFGQAMYRLKELGHGPGGNVGDALTALTTIDIAEPGTPDWSFDGTVDREAFAKLEFRETSLGIEKAQREHREGWWAHAQRNRAFILDAAKALPQRRLAVVLGAGAPFDLPLADLARQFERLVLVDIDEAALGKTLELVWKTPAERARVTTRALDLTGVNAAIVREVDALLAAPVAGPEEMEANVSRFCRSYRLTTPPVWGDAGDKADLVVSSCVLSQLAWPQRTYAERLFDKRFGKMPAALEARWSTAWTELGLRVQQDHISALGDAATTVVLTSDVVSHQTALDATGRERDTGKTVLPLGVDRLLERIPSSFEVGRHAKWEWSRYRPSRRGTEGSRMDVEGVVLTDRWGGADDGRAGQAGKQTPGGLWLP